jgi:arylsulfatase A-like enzyme
VIVLVASMGVIMGFAEGTLVAGRILATQHYLQNGLYRLAALVTQREWTLGVLGFVVLALLGAPIWVLITRNREGAKRTLFAILAGVVLAALALFVLKDVIRLHRMGIDGVDGMGTITLGYLITKIGGPGRLAVLVGVGVILPLVVLAALWPIFRRLGRVMGRPGVRRVLTRLALATVALTAVLNGAVIVDRVRLPDSPPVILISIDTLRADRLGCYGYPRDTTPHIDALARLGVRYTNCYVQSPWTLSSHMSMLTSRYTHSHGVSRRRSLPSTVDTLAELLRNEGYTTLGVARSITWMDGRYGFWQGFDAYYVRNFDEDAAVQNDFLLKVLDGHTQERLFLFLHYFDVHSDFTRLPYDSPPEYQERFTSNYRGTFDGGDGTRYASRFLQYANEQGLRLSVEDREYISSLYDAGLAYLDRCMGDLFRELDERGILDDALLIFTSDHGEEFQEHDFLLHSNPRHHGELMRVPLIVKEPMGRGPAVVVPDVVESVDIAPSILTYIGATPPPTWQGGSFLGGPPIRGEEAAGPDDGPFGRLAFTELYRSYSVTSEDWRLLAWEEEGERRFALFDRLEDPGETRDVIEVHSTVAADLLVEYNAMRGRGEVATGSGEIRLSEEQREALEALGYIE